MNDNKYIVIRDTKGNFVQYVANTFPMPANTRRAVVSDLNTLFSGLQLYLVAKIEDDSDEQP